MPAGAETVAGRGDKSSAAPRTQREALRGRVERLVEVWKAGGVGEHVLTGQP